jgi:thiamine pyrophosphokinase
MTTLIFLGGELAGPANLGEYLVSNPRIVAVDGGADHCRRLGLIPDLLLGDLDSVSAETLHYCRQMEVEIETHPPRKNATDLQLALDRALVRGDDPLVLFAALGGRWDMSLANVLTAASPAYRSLSITIAGEDCRLHILHPGRPFVVKGAAGQVVSLLALHGDAAGITLDGFEYPLVEATLAAGSSQGVSNVMAGARGTVSLRHGVLLLVHMHGDMRDSPKNSLPSPGETPKMM